MHRTVVVGVRLNPVEAQRLAELARRVERTPSDVLRRLIAAAEVQPGGPAVVLGAPQTQTEVLSK